jgi:hypothetical protein
MHRTKTIAFADDLILAIRGRTVAEAENLANRELTKIVAWARDNKIHFNEQKSQTILMSRRKHKEQNEVRIFLNSRPLTQVQCLKYLGIILDQKLTFKEHKLHFRQINFRSFQICQIKLGTGARGAENNLHRRYSAFTKLRSFDLDKSPWKNLL